MILLPLSLGHLAVNRFRLSDPSAAAEDLVKRHHAGGPGEFRRNQLLISRHLGALRIQHFRVGSRSVL